MAEWAKQGVVVTTPNPDVVDVKAIDPDHISEVNIRQFHGCNYSTVTAQFFGMPDDTIIAWKGDQ